MHPRPLHRRMACSVLHIAPVTTSLGACSEGSVPLRLRQLEPAGVLDIHAVCMRVCMPTEASWFNLIEAQFGRAQRVAVANTDDPDHVTRRRRVYGYL